MRARTHSHARTRTRLGGAWGQFSPRRERTGLRRPPSARSACQAGPAVPGSWGVRGAPTAPQTSKSGWPYLARTARTAVTEAGMRRARGYGIEGWAGVAGLAGRSAPRALSVCRAPWCFLTRVVAARHWGRPACAVRLHRGRPGPPASPRAPRALADCALRPPAALSHGPALHTATRRELASASDASPGLPWATPARLHGLRSAWGGDVIVPAWEAVGQLPPASPSPSPGIVTCLVPRQA